MILCSLAICLSAQDEEQFKSIITELSSARYQGRGYARDGVVKAGEYITDEFRKAGADEVTMQPFCIDINTFPGKMKMSVDGHKLTPGRDFVVREYSAGAKGRASSSRTRAAKRSHTTTRRKTTSRRPDSRLSVR